jgi:hypothetical protein
MTFLAVAVEAVEGIAGDILGLGEEIAGQIKERGEAYIPLDSSAISALQYRGDRTLTIVFTDGRRYLIDNFPALELERWINAGSAGAYFNAYVRGKY